MVDIESPVATSVSDVNRSPDLKQLFQGPSQCSGGVRGGESLDDLTEFLHIQDGHSKLASQSILPLSYDKNDSSNVEKEEQCEEPHQTESAILTSEKCLPKDAPFQWLAVQTLFAVDGEDEKVEDEEEKDDLADAVLNENGCASVNPAHPRPLPLPTPLNLVSALKGSREKQGTPPKNLTVTWAPDVYDPPPSPSTTVTITKPRPKSESKKNGKNKWKGKYSKGGSSKDKKQVRKHGGSSKCYQPRVDYDSVVDFNRPFEKQGEILVLGAQTRTAGVVS